VLQAKQATDSLIAVFEDESADFALRKEAGMALGNIGDTKAIPALKEAIRKDFDLDYSARYALGIMKIHY
jgi:HEAT repeat protein